LASCIAVGLIGLLLLHLLRYRSLRQQLTIATLLPVVAVATTVLINVQLMFLSAHDSLVILIALLVSLLLAALGAWLVVRRISRASRRVGAGLHQLVSDSARGTSVVADSVETAAAPRELAQVLDDLAETRRTLAESRARERAAEQSRQELVSFMSHDLRTPLAGLRALSEGLEDGVINDVPRAMSHLRATVARMSVLVDDLFALSRVQGTRDAKPQTMVSLTELISDVATESEATARTQGVRLDVDLPENDRLAVLGSSDDLARALTNLTTNAIRHTDPELLVRLEGRRTDDGHIRKPTFPGYSTPGGEGRLRGAATTAELAWGWPLRVAWSSRTAVRSWYAMSRVAAVLRWPCRYPNRRAIPREGSTHRRRWFHRPGSS
jgi:signal transduction histidine kinase